MSSDFHHLKIGDKVIVCSSHFAAKDRVGIVKKMTPAKVYIFYGKTAGNWFWKKNGKRVGDASTAGGPMHSKWIIPYDPEHADRVAETEFRDKFVQRMRVRKWHNVSTDAMRRILTIIVAEEAGS